MSRTLILSATIAVAIISSCHAMDQQPSDSSELQVVETVELCYGNENNKIQAVKLRNPTSGEISYKTIIPGMPIIPLQENQFNLYKKKLKGKL